MSLSAGVRGASIAAGRKGVYGNAGLPGSGLSIRKKLSGGGVAKQRVNSSEVVLRVDAEGRLWAYHEDKRAVTEREMQKIRRQYGALLRALLEEYCDERNEELEHLQRLHWRTPKPTKQPAYEKDTFSIQKPKFSLIMRLLGHLLPFVRRKLKKQKSDWEQSKFKFESEENQRKLTEEVDVFHSIDAMELTLARYLSLIDWPIQPEIDFDLGDDNTTIEIDVLLPQEQDFPSSHWSVPANQYRVNEKQLPATKTRQLYRDYVHALIFRIVGEVFARLPTVEVVVISGYRVITDARTGNPKNEYIISGACQREGWAVKNFGQLKSIDPVEALTLHKLERKMTKTGVFKEIQPLQLKDISVAS